MTGTVIRENEIDLGPGTVAYSWVHGHEQTTFEDNLDGAGTGDLVPGTQPTINPFLFAIRIFAP